MYVCTYIHAYTYCECDTEDVHTYVWKVATQTSCTPTHGGCAFSLFHKGVLLRLVPEIDTRAQSESKIRPLFVGELKSGDRYVTVLLVCLSVAVSVSVSVSLAVSVSICTCIFALLGK